MAIGVLLAFEATQTDFDRSFPTGHPLNGGQQPQLPSQPQSAAAQPRRRLSLTKQTPSAHAVVLAGPPRAPESYRAPHWLSRRVPETPCLSGRKPRVEDGPS